MALAKLRPQEVEVLALCVWEEVAVRDAAVALGVAEGTVRSRLSRARSRLRALADPAPEVPPGPTTLTTGLGAQR